MMISFTNEDGRKVCLAISAISYITEITAEQLKTAPLAKSTIYVNKSTGGGGFYARDSIETLKAAWLSAAGQQHRLQ